MKLECRLSYPKSHQSDKNLCFLVTHFMNESLILVVFDFFEVLRDYNIDLIEDSVVLKQHSNNTSCLLWGVGKGKGGQRFVLGNFRKIESQTLNVTRVGGRCLEMTKKRDVIFECCP